MSITKKESFAVLIVDDDKDDQYLLTHAMKRTPYDIRLKFVDDGKQLIKYLEGLDANGANPDIILLDINMPEKDGLESLKAIKKSNKLCSIPIVMFTTSNAELDIENAMFHGANSYVVKPADFESLVSTLNSICSYWFSTVELVPKRAER